MVKRVVNFGENKHDQICFNILKTQSKIMRELVRNKIYNSLSQICRFAIEDFLSKEYTKALQKNHKKIYNEIIKAHRGKKK